MEVFSCLGSLVKSCSGKGGMLQTYVTGLCGEHSQCFGHTGFAFAHGCVLSPSTLLRLPDLYMERSLCCGRFQFSGTPQKRRLGCTCVLCLPRPSSSGSQELDWRTLPGCGVPSPLHGPSLSFRARRLGSPCVCFGELVSSRNPPSRCQPSRISGSLWLEVGSLFAVC